MFETYHNAPQSQMILRSLIVRFKKRLFTRFLLYVYIYSFSIKTEKASKVHVLKKENSQCTDIPLSPMTTSLLQVPLLCKCIKAQCNWHFKISAQMSEKRWQDLQLRIEHTEILYIKNVIVTE